MADIVHVPRPRLSLRDRAAIAAVRGIGKPAIALLSSAPLIRKLTDGPAKWAKSAPAGTRITERADGGLDLRPPNAGDQSPWLIYVHGGGFLAGSPWTHLGLAGHLGDAARMRVYLPRYGLAPERPFPKGRDDLIAAYRAHLDKHGAPAALAGDSAGGNLALLVAQHARDAGWPLPRAMALLSPVADLSGDIADRMAQARDEMLFPAARLPWIRDTYLQGRDAADPGASPLLGDLGRLPRTLVQASAVEAARPDAEALGQRMDDATVELWDGLHHVWHIFAGRAPVADAALARVAAFLRAAS